MTISIKSPTSTTGSIQKNGSDVITIDASDNVTVANDLTVSGSKVGIGGTPSEPLSVFRTGGQEAGINIRNTSSGNGSRLTFETTRSDDSSVQDMAAIQVYAVAGYDSAANSDAIMTFQTQDSGTTAEKMRIQSNGTVLVNATVAVGTGKFQAAFNSGFCSTMNSVGNGADYIQFWNGSEVGSIKRVGGSGVSYNTSSDYRLKENVVPMSGSIDRLKQLKPSTWAWVQDGSHGEGFLAHEAQEVVPESVHGTKDAVDVEGNPVYQGIDQSKLVPLLTAALQEAIKRIEALEAK